MKNDEIIKKKKTQLYSESSITTNVLEWGEHLDQKTIIKEVELYLSVKFYQNIYNLWICRLQGVNRLWF